MTEREPSIRMLGGLLTFVVLAAACGAALAGRPLAVDDADTNDKGSGHVELWLARAPGSTVFNVSPAYAPFDGIEFAAAWSRERSTRVELSALQAKWRITDSRERGCKLGSSFGVTHESGGGDRARFVNGLLTCNAGGAGSAHLNLGWVKASGAASIATWGLAVEREWGAVTPHLEVFGQRHGRPTLQFGLRTDVADGLQIDGSIGRHEGRTLTTLGLKLGF